MLRKIIEIGLIFCLNDPVSQGSQARGCTQKRRECWMLMIRWDEATDGDIEWGHTNYQGITQETGERREERGAESWSVMNCSLWYLHCLMRSGGGSRDSPPVATSKHLSYQLSGRCRPLWPHMWAPSPPTLSLLSRDFSCTSSLSDVGHVSPPLPYTLLPPIVPLHTL